MQKVVYGPTIQCIKIMFNIINVYNDDSKLQRCKIYDPNCQMCHKNLDYAY